MSIAINQNLFRHHETRSAAFNNLCTIIHKLTEDGDYLGEVVGGKRLLGTFRLRCARSNGAQQVNIDLSSFDPLFATATNPPGPERSNEYALAEDGFIVFHVSGHHGNLYVTLTRIQEKKTAPRFDSRSLNKGDIVALRLWNPGTYTIANEAGGQRATIHVRRPEDGKAYELPKLQPVKVRLAESGFDPSQIDQMSFQALVIDLETTAALVVKQNEAAKASSPDTPRR